MATFHFRTQLLLTTAALACFSSSRTLVAEGESLTRPIAWTTAFAEEEVKIVFKVVAEVPVKGQLLWSLSTSEELVILRGEIPCDAAAELEVSLQLPTVKPGVVFETLFAARLHRDGEREPVATYETPLHIYPRNPFHDQLETLKKRELKLFDPAGNTAKILTAAEVPFEQIFNVSAIGELKTGELLIGEGISFREERSLGELLVQAAGRGVPVLCLAPSAGELELPRPSDKPPGSVAVTFERGAFVRRLDKRFDDKFWMQHPVAAVNSMTTGGRAPQLLIEMEAGDTGWRWLELQVASRTDAEQADSEPNKLSEPTKLIVLSLPIVANWEAGPTPRFLLAHLLNYVTPTSLPIPAKPIPAKPILKKTEAP
jgi:hypothetical protein